MACVYLQTETSTDAGEVWIKQVQGIWYQVQRQATWIEVQICRHGCLQIGGAFQGSLNRTGGLRTDKVDDGLHKVHVVCAAVREGIETTVFGTGKQRKDQYMYRHDVDATLHALGVITIQDHHNK